MKKLSKLLIATITITITMMSSLTPVLITSGLVIATITLPSKGIISSVSTGISQSIQRAGIAGYMTWDGVWMDPQAFAFAQTHFNTMELGAYQWENYPISAIQSFKNAGMTP